jgi:hypothetical protein
MDMARIRVIAIMNADCNPLRVLAATFVIHVIHLTEYDLPGLGLDSHRHDVKTESRCQPSVFDLVTILAMHEDNTEQVHLGLVQWP